MAYLHYEKKLKEDGKKDQQKFLILLSDQTVIIDTEAEAMKQARRIMKGTKKYITEMIPTDARINKQRTTLTNLLENLETYKSESNVKSEKKVTSKEIQTRSIG